MADPCVLGCGDTVVYFTDRCGTQTACQISDQISEIEYNRVLDDTSEAVMTVNLGGGISGGTCCECVGDLRSWYNSVTIRRNSEVVWGPGPIVGIVYKNDTATITARDISAWLDVRVVHESLNFVEAEVLDIAKAVVKDAMSLDDPCRIYDRIITQDRESFSPTKITKDFPGSGVMYSGEALRDLASTVLDFTVIGNTLLMAEALTFGPYTRLAEEDFLDELEIEERGIETGTKWYVPGAGGVVGTSGDQDEFYGLIEQIAPADDNVKDIEQANAGAAARRLVTQRPPVYINVPDGARLSPDAAVCFRQLVPGTLINVYLTNGCRKITDTRRLTAVKVRVNGGSEEVGITLSPVGVTIETSGEERMNGKSVASRGPSTARFALTLRDLTDRIRRLESRQVVTVGRWALSEDPDTGDLIATKVPSQPLEIPQVVRLAFAAVASSASEDQGDE